MSLRGGTTKQSRSYILVNEHKREEIATLRNDISRIYIALHLPSHYRVGFGGGAGFYPAGEALFKVVIAV
jgi:hypothetical protein